MNPNKIVNESCDLSLLQQFLKLKLKRDSRCAVVPGECEQLFCDPTSLLNQWQTQSPDTSQPSLFCTQSECLARGPPLHICPLIV